MALLGLFTRKRDTSSSSASGPSDPSVAAPRALYDAARMTRRTGGWQASSTGPNREIKSDLQPLRDRHRDLARNNPWARRAISIIVHNTIGHGIIAKWADPQRQARWDRWFTRDVDADGRLDGYGLQSLVMRTLVEAGECLIRRRPRRISDGLTVPLQIQVLEPDYLDHRLDRDLPTGGYIRQGVEFDPIGRRVGYWLFRSHPGEGGGFPSEPYRVDASEILHVYRIDRPGQVRGVPWGTGAMLRLRMLDDYQDAQLERARLSACFMAFRRQVDPDSSLQEFTVYDRLEPGAIETLPYGVDVTFADPPQPQDDGRFVAQVLRAVAADYGVTYEALTGDLSEVNFSSARMGWQEFGRAIDVWRWQILEPQFLRPLARWFMEAEVVAGYATDQEEEVPLWTAPARTLVDPTREIPAIRDAIRTGLLSLPQAIRQQGYDPYVLAEEHAEYLRFLDRLGVRTDADARDGQVNDQKESSQ